MELPGDAWHGTSDTSDALARRAQLTPTQRFEWLVAMWDLALDRGLLHADRRARQDACDALWASTPG